MRLTATAILWALLIAAPATAGDLIYHAKGSDAPDILTTFDGQEYWKPLARCSGVFTSIAVHLRNDGKADAAAEVEGERNLFMRGYATRISTDRGITLQAALDVARQFSLDSAAMADDAIAEDASAQGALITQCEKAYNIVIQETGM